MIPAGRSITVADPIRIATRVLLDNASAELSRQELVTRSDTIFDTSVEVMLPRAAHRPLRLDRVEPSYRFRHFMNYPAIGLNCGVTESIDGDTMSLRTTWSPRFVQPRVVPRDPQTSVRFADLAAPTHDVGALLSIPHDYERWITDEERRLRQAVRDGLQVQEADIESKRLGDAGEKFLSVAEREDINKCRRRHRAMCRAQACPAAPPGSYRSAGSPTSSRGRRELRSYDSVDNAKDGRMK